MSGILTSTAFSDATFPVTHTLLVAGNYIITSWVVDVYLVEPTAVGNWSAVVQLESGGTIFDNVSTSGTAAAATPFVQGNKHLMFIPDGLVLLPSSNITLVVSTPVNVTAVDTIVSLFGYTYF